MPSTARLGIVLMDDAMQGKASNHNTAINAIDAAIAGLTLANAFVGNNTFAGTSKFGGAVGGNGAGLPLKSVSVTFSPTSDYTLLSSEYEAVFITINTTNITAPQNMIFPTTVGALWIVTNNSGFSITCKTAAGTGIAVAASRRAILTGGGVNLTRITQDSVTTP